MRAGFVALVGLPNVGKSTLMNVLLGQKIAIVAPRPQTTRNRILGVKNTDGAQLVLVDTPGIHAPGTRGAGRSHLNRFMNDEALAAVTEVEVLCWLVEAPEGGEAARRIVGTAGGGRRKGGAATGGYHIPPDAERLLATLRDAGKPIVLVLSKVDRLGDKRALLPVMEAWSKAHPFAAIVPIAAALGDVPHSGIDRLVGELAQLLPEGPALFPEEMVTDRAERWLAAELVREQVFLLTRQEVPYAVAVTIDEYEERDKSPTHPHNVMIHATVHVEKEAQKRIVVGEGGHMVREIGSRARLAIEGLLDCPVHLKLFVRVDPDWTTTVSGIRKMGYE